MAKVMSHLSEIEIRHRGWKALVKELGPSAASRFLLQYEEGRGDYAALKKSLFSGKNVEKMAKDIAAAR